MQVLLKRWDDGASVRIPAALVAAARLNFNDPVEMREENGRIIIEPLTHTFYTLDDLLAHITPDNVHAEVSTGPLTGHEAW